MALSERRDRWRQFPFCCLFHYEKGIAFGQGLIFFLGLGFSDTAATQPIDDGDTTNSLAVILAELMTMYQ